MDTSEIISNTMIFFRIMDPLGNIPRFLSVLKNVEPKRRIKVTFRELIIAYVALLIYLFFGRYILDVLALSNESIAISGGIIVFLIAIRIIFPTPHGIFGETEYSEPLIAPFAIPVVAGPSIMAMLMLMATTESVIYLFARITIAWVLSAILLLSASL